MCPIAGLSEEPPEDRDLKEKRDAKMHVSRGVEPHCGLCHGRASAYAHGILSA